MANLKNNSISQKVLPKAKKSAFDAKNRVLWTLVFIAIAAFSIWAVASQIKDFSFKSFGMFIVKANPFWLILALLAMFGFILFEGFALLYICREYGYKKSFKSGFIYSASDIYFSAITPSATGGQPASAFFMMRDGIPGSFVTAALICNLLMYTSSIVALGFLAVISNLEAFFGFSVVSKVLIIAGIITQVLLLAFFVLLLFKKGVMQKLCFGTVKLLGKLHIIRKVDKTLEKLSQKMDEYSKHTSFFKGKGKFMLVVFILNLLQRASQTAVTPFVYLASGGELSKAYDVFITQIYVLVGANCVPVPGAMGITDYLMLDGFKMMGIENYEFLELFSRSLSFYTCIVICGITVLFGLINASKQRKNKQC